MDPITGAVLVACIVFGAISCSDGGYTDPDPTTRDPEPSDNGGESSIGGDYDDDIEKDIENDSEFESTELETPPYQCMNGRVNSCYSRVGLDDGLNGSDDPVPGHIVDMDIRDGRLFAITGRNSNRFFSMDVTSDWTGSVIAERGPRFANEATDSTPLSPEQLIEIEEDAVLIPYAMGEYSGVAFLQPSDRTSPIMNNSFIPFTIEGDPEANPPISDLDFEPTGVQSILPYGDGILVGGLDLLTNRGMLVQYDLRSSHGPLKQTNLDMPILTNNGRIISMRYLDEDDQSKVVALSNTKDSLHLDVIDLSANEVVTSMAMSGCLAVDIPEMLPMVEDAKEEKRFVIIPADCDGEGKVVVMNVDDVSVGGTIALPEVPRDAVVVGGWLVCMIGATDLFCTPFVGTSNQTKSANNIWPYTPIEVGSNLCSMVANPETYDIFIASGGRLNEKTVGDDSPCQYVSRVTLSSDFVEDSDADLSE